MSGAGGGKPECPCADGLPDPCTLCGEPADGVCAIDTLRGWKHRALAAEAEVERWKRKARQEEDTYRMLTDAVIDMAAVLLGERHRHTIEFGTDGE